MQDGAKAAAHVIRVNGKHRPRRFSTWAPKALATIRVVADTLEDRATVVKVQREPPLRLRAYADATATSSPPCAAGLSAVQRIISTCWLTPNRSCPTGSMTAPPTTGGCFRFWPLLTSPVASGQSRRAGLPASCRASRKTAPSCRTPEGQPGGIWG